MRTKNELFMSEALRLAKKRSGFTFPNPTVGAVLVKNDKIIGRGYHKKAGMPHAEIEAFLNATEDPKGATLFVTLEPCCIFGRTPPCTDEIIKKGISHVVCSVTDPNPKMQGAGIEKLKKAGIDVTLGIFEQKARKLNEGFFTYHQKKRPYVAVKFAASLDGKIATRTNDSKWITNQKARDFARRLRSEYHAVVVGINTVLLDNPHLGALQNLEPLRIILDSTLKIPLTSDVLRNKNVMIVTTIHADSKKFMEIQKKGIEILHIKKEKISVQELLSELYKREIISIFVEGGGEVLGSFADSKIVDRVYAFYAPLLIGGTGAVSALKGEGIAKVTDAIKLEDLSIKKLGDNVLITGTATH
jgi:diaminohydroxyphosphoribosylaminopyrimidine deaminase/5-amino-6-(5-phosphoribosylamino)uracil reductase